MKRKLSILLLIIGLTSVIAPGLIQNVKALGCKPPGCQLDVITHVPVSERPGGIRIISNQSATVYTLNHTFTFPNRTVWSITVLDTYFIGAVSGYRYSFKQWTYTGTGQQWDSTPTMSTPPMYTNYTVVACSGTLNCPFLAEFTVSPPLGCKTNCYLDALTNVPSADGTIKVQDKNGAVFPLNPSSPQTFAWLNGSRQTLTVLNQTFAAPSGTHYSWKQWICACSTVPANSSTILTIPAIYSNYTDPLRNPPLNGVGGFTAQFDKQYKLTLTFSDQQGNALSAPASLQIVTGNTVVNLTSYSGIYESAAVWTIRNVVWEGVTALEVPGQTVDLTSGSASATIKLYVYSATIKAVDTSSSQNPVSGVTVTVSFANSTTRAFQTNSQGLVQLGDIPTSSYTAVVSYKGAAICNCIVDTSNPQNNPYVVQVNVGNSPTTTTPLVSALVLLTIFGLATFLIVLAIWTRKRPPPPVIE